MQRTKISSLKEHSAAQNSLHWMYEAGSCRNHLSTSTLDILAGGPLTGASMNPALAGGYRTGRLLYWIGPLLGGIVASLVYARWIGKEGVQG